MAVGVDFLIMNAKGFLVACSGFWLFGFVEQVNYNSDVMLSRFILCNLIIGL